MSQKNWLKLILLAAIWGSSFIFMRMLSPLLGPTLTTTLRILIAGIVMHVGFRIFHINSEWRRWWPHYLVIGLMNAAIPFFLFAYAAHFLPAGYSAIINASTPLFGALFATLWLKEILSMRKLASLLLGIAGVAVLSYRGHTATETANFQLAIGACLCATMCYGLASTYIRKMMTGVPSLPLAGSSQLLGGLCILPFALFSTPDLVAIQTTGWTTVILSILGLSLLCSAVAFILYFNLIQETGSQALTVTLLIPLFGLLWSWLFLDEPVTATMLIGCALVLISTRLVTKSATAKTNIDKPNQ